MTWSLTRWRPVNEDTLRTWGEGFLSAFWVLLQCSQVISECSLSVPWVFSECSRSVLRLCSQHAQSLLRMCYECAIRMLAQSVLWVCSECAKGTSAYIHLRRAFLHIYIVKFSSSLTNALFSHCYVCLFLVWVTRIAWVAHSCSEVHWLCCSDFERVLWHYGAAGLIVAHYGYKSSLRS